MSNVLIIIREPEYCASCRSVFQRAGHRVLARAEIVDALVELNWFIPDLIVWEFDARRLIELKALGLLRSKGRKTPLMLCCAENDTLSTFEGMAELILPSRVPPEQLLTKARPFLKEPTYANDQPAATVVD